MAETQGQAEARAFLAKAAQNLAAAEADHAAARYDACANRAYYCCFQAAVAALLVESIRPAGTGDRWGHELVQAQFAGTLIRQRKRYPADLRSTLQENRRVRDQGDYRPVPVTQESASRALRRAGICGGSGGADAMATETRRIKGLERLPDARVREVVGETCDTIQQTFPDAEFRIYPNPSHRGAIVEVYTDSDDVDAVVEPVVDRLVDLLVDEDISIRVWPSSRAWLRPDS